MGDLEGFQSSGSMVCDRKPRYAASLAIPGPGSFALCGAQKNDLWLLRSSAVGGTRMRPTAAAVASLN